MIGSKGHAAGAKCRRGRSHKRKQAPEGDREGFAWVSGSGDGGSGVGGELDGAGDERFIGVQVSSTIVEIKKYLGKRSFYKTVKAEEPVAAIIHDLARLHVNPNYPEDGLNIGKVKRRIMTEAEIAHTPIGKSFLVEFVKQHPLELKDNDQFEELKEQIVKQGRQCFRELIEQIEKRRLQCSLTTLITGDREQHVQGRRRKDLDPIPPPLPDDCAQAWKDGVAEVVAEFPSPKGKLLFRKYLIRVLEENWDAKSKSALITSLESQLPAQKQREGLKDGELFLNPFVRQV